ncbi:MAG: hypothetical protein J6L00_04195 [Clostridia bacterium]|nr:hypothetical protein [Clostridia bacterium]
MEIRKENFFSSYAVAARKRLDSENNSLDTIRRGFVSRMEGRTVPKIVAALVGILVWAAAYANGYLYTKEHLLLSRMFDTEIETIILQVAICLMLVLFLCMLLDDISSLLYFGRIAKGKQTLAALKRRIDNSKNDIAQNDKMFLEAEKNGWNFPLKIAPSIPKEAGEVGMSVSNVRKLKTGFFRKAKNILFFAATVIVSGAFCIAMADHAQDLYLRWGNGEYSEAVTIVSYVVMGLVCVGEIILAKLVWSATDCTVTPVTLLILLAAPVAFVLLTAVAQFVIIGVVAIVSLAIAIAGVVFGVMCLSAFSGG